MQTSYSSSRILLPVRPWFIACSLLLALLLNFLPTAAWPAVPDWTALLIVFWSVREPRRVGMGLAFLFGVAMDVADASLLGQHALAYVLVAYAASSLSRRILWFPLAQQALQVFPLLLLVQLVQFGVRMLIGGDFPGIGYFLGPVFSALLWPLLTFLLLLPQHQPVDRDDNRPL
ncbi:MAG TPA: rod shape-determining protein MreD [Accumulibacter sp.]|uniref:rod shape-determining protein MreD n=1 Tax=Accumulibacter sp. TaxID=2053492 RepID=UPI0025DED892|nr:rod shape-determining protein MreD [Accumulibacter sp.]MCM8598209.1 rod shape-determining protein MreD [Accumulibacter sp.]MCM8662696.1 rod shape-determining protein MreD [Accumulibacter sp.]HNC52779.1 rod shape-determining protein MreD [Accumulibacter sp.]